MGALTFSPSNLVLDSLADAVPTVRQDRSALVLKTKGHGESPTTVKTQSAGQKREFTVSLPFSSAEGSEGGNKGESSHRGVLCLLPSA